LLVFIKQVCICTLSRENLFAPQINNLIKSNFANALGSALLYGDIQVKARKFNLQTDKIGVICVIIQLIKIHGKRSSSSRD
jgi:hypothetical protein